MISILIPIYNVDVTDLVKDLHLQCLSLQADFEIILIDDASIDKNVVQINRKLTKYSNVNYTELPQNIGRSKIRNLLAAKAKFENLLFLDCDAAIVKNDFVLKYVQMMDKYTILCGGRIYDDIEPDKSYYLHWLYGTKVESVKAKERSRNNYRSFMTNNFMIKKSVFDHLSFNENLSTYGHEDTLFGFEAREKGIGVSHIDNPVLHVHLESTSEFISKSIQATHNLARIESNIKTKSDIRLLRISAILEKFRLNHLTFKLISTFIDEIEKNLKGPKPSIKLFSLFKLYHYMLFKRSKN